MQTQKERKRKPPVSAETRALISSRLKHLHATGQLAKPVGNTHNHATGPQPWRWKHGPDPVRKAMNLAHLRHRAQAKYRDEPYKLSFTDWEHIWRGKWHLRGRAEGCLWLCRRDNRKPWSRGNCYLGQRNQHFRHVYKNYDKIK